MTEQEKTEALAIMNERFGNSKDNLLPIATIDGDKPAVRNVDAIYEDGSFYVITYALSGKMKQIAVNPNIAVCGEWFTGRGTGENLGWVRAENNKELAEKLRKAFEAWYSNGHVNEEDENNIILRIKLETGTLACNGKWYSIDFADCFKG